MRRDSMLKKLIFMALSLLLLCGCMTTTKQVSAATATSKVPITTYLKGYSTVRTYNAVNGGVTGAIYSSDKCTVLNIYSSGWCRVKYPVSGGTRIAYTYSSYFFTNTNFSTATTKPGKNRTVYGKPNLSYKLGTTYSSDSILIIGSANGNQQILYPISGGYKMGFISGSISTSSDSSYSSVIYNGTTSEIENLCFDAKYYADTYSDLKAVFGYDSAKLLNHWKTCGIKEGRGASPILDLTYYMANNADLRNFYGSKNYAGAYEHFLKYGYAEFRASSKYYYGDYYRKNNADLKSFDSKFLLKHYLQYGINEKRYANTVRYTPDGSSANNNAAASSSTTAQKIVNYEISQIGVGDYRGNNNVVYNTWYYGRSVSGNGYAWCMAFQAYCANQFGVLNKAIPKTASCTQAVNWYKNRGQFHYSKYYGGNYTPKAGDLVFYYDTSKKQICHVGMITSSPVNGYLQTVEGNIQCVDGNWKVQSFSKNAKRTVNHSYVYGYASPAY